MRKLSALFSYLMIAVGFFLMTEKQAHAYTDPGSSLLILQTVGSVITATGLYFRRRIAAFFKRGKSAGPDTSEESAPSLPE
jgi:hypothetical protein